MPLSKEKREKIALRTRRAKVNDRSLDGHGYFMDTHVESYAKRYIETGDEKWLAQVPDYSKFRKDREARK